VPDSSGGLNGSQIASALFRSPTFLVWVGANPVSLVTFATSKPADEIRNEAVYLFMPLSIRMVGGPRGYNRRMIPVKGQGVSDFRTPNEGRCGASNLNP
jgi:hypothetical protein